MEKRRFKQKQMPEQIHFPFNGDVEHYKQLIDLSPNAELICGEEGLLDFNTATLTLFGVSSRDCFDALSLADLSPEFQPNGQASQLLYKELIQSVLLQGTANIKCQCKKLSTGETFPVEMVMSLLELPDETIYRLTLLDLSNNKHWQNALLVRTDNIATSNRANNCLITASAEGNITHINEQACRLTGWVFVEVIGQPISIVMHVKDENMIGSTLFDGELGIGSSQEVPISEGCVLISKKGERIEVQGSIAPQLLNNSQYNGCVISFGELVQATVINEELQWHATHDPLTRLPNRTLLADRFKQALFVAARHESLLAICMMDLDEFKPINDTYGHAVGDLLLIEVASRIKQYLRQEDTVARLGGDEFAILIGGVQSKSELFQALQRLRTAVAEPYYIESKTITISCSIGGTLYPEDNADADTLLRHADQAMFVAKQAGRNRVHWFDLEQDQQANSSQKWIARIEQALINGEFELYYQPKVNMRTGKVVGMEALIRWNHPEEGLIQPLDFLPFIEQNDLIIGVGEWVISSALMQLTAWQKLGFNWSVSINIAAKHFHVSSFTSRIKHTLQRFPGINPENLEIEILESIALGDIQHVQKVIEECQQFGVRFALDDFGTGYSSLSYLKRLPANVLKIDQSFIRDILDDKEDLALVQAISSLAVTFGREVVAEGVETIEHGALLMRLGCDVAQGYGIARPMPAEKVAAWAEGFASHPMWAIWSKTEWDLKAFPLLVAQYDIREWTKMVVDRIEDGTLPIESATLSDESKCRFGIWYHSEGLRKFGKLESFNNIDPVHCKLHQLGDEVIQLYKDRKIEQAQQLCVTLHEVKNDLLNRLDELQLEVFS